MDQQTADYEALGYETLTDGPFVISANYKDRTSPKKWLVRRESEGVDKAIPCAEIIAEDITVQTATFEKGFFCDSVMGCRLPSLRIKREPSQRAISFTRYHFDEGDFRDSKGNYLRSAKLLHLTEYGETLAQA